MATPVRTHVGKAFETMRDAVVELLLFRICFCIGLADTFGDDFGIALLVAGILAIGALHASCILEKIAAESTAHDVIELLCYEFVPVHFVHLLLALPNGTLAVEADIEPSPVFHLFCCR
jgi:hypothetical protein